MEHYALRLLQPAFAAPPGMRVIVLRDEAVEDGPPELVHEVRLVVGFQSQVIHHYTSNDPRPVHPDPAVMEKLGWHYKHQDCHCAPISVTATGRLETLNPNNPCWILIDPDTRGERLEQLSKKLLEDERLRRTIEHRIEELDQDSLASD